MLDHGLSDKTVTIIYDILKKYPQIKQAILYGSRAKGNFRPGSDIDLTLKGDVDYQTVCRISTDLDDSWIAYEVDLSSYSSLKDPYLLKEIDDHGVVFFEAQ
ncbi:nucleotidyltransferase domain-containing protein [Piscirickettsia litoralis]|uniref:Polymerase beta nucleotidyltransferase domain-containing protein n=1 Tax=Piscirickettsia litoralis TaxID=1891921 RepID=A0ABX2ZWJ3_9GAMM|nr:nucleotidyltransferase domain-containing protein [Piscirickettsia litoralis]ODN40996.1 hypothetical protein BGC07_18715 [Piscirickettsia litoralis]